MFLYTVASLTAVRARVKCVLIYCNIIDSGQNKSKVCFYYTVTSLTAVRAREKCVLKYFSITDSGQNKRKVCSYIL